MLNTPKYLNNLSFVIHAWFEKPALILRSILFFLMKLSGKHVVRGMDIALSYACNLSCTHCNVASQHNKNKEEMTNSEIISAINQLKKSGGFYVTFTGGEVLLNIDRLETIIDAIGKKSMLFQVQTNGTLLNDKICKRLKHIGVDNVQISFDTFHETASWTQVIAIKKKQVRMLKANGLDIFFTWLASHKSLKGHEIKDIIRFSNDHKVKIGLNFAVPQGRWREKNDMLLDGTDSINIRKIAKDNNYLYIDLQNNLFNYGCPAFSERFHINAYGDVQPCTFFQIKFGNITEEPLSDILKRGVEHPLFASFPDHCPPAENQEYLKYWQQNDFRELPVPYNKFEHFSGFPETSQTCPVCNANVNIPFLSNLPEVEYGLPWKGTLMKCSGCGLIQQVPILRVNEALDFYPDEYIHYNPEPGGIKGFLMQIYMNRTVNLLKSLNVKKGDTLLDIGSGAGEKLKILKDRLSLDVTGIEPDKRAASVAKDLFGIEIINDTFSADNFEPDTFDFVRINHVIEHVPDPVKLLNDIHTVLKPGGWLIGETENISCLSFRVFKKYWALLHLPYHLVLFSKKTLKATFQNSLFKKAAIKDTGDPPAWSLSLQNYLRRNDKSGDRKSARMRGYILLTLMSTPLTWVETLCGNGPVIEFFAQKKKY